MKKVLTSLAVAGCLAMGATMAHAADGTIQFQGKLVDASCTFNVNGQGEDATIILPTVVTSALSAPGNVAGHTPFTVALSNCPTELNVRVRFEASAMVNPATGNVLNMTGSATNVELQLLDGSDTPIVVGTTTGDYVPATTGSASFPYAVQYITVADNATPTPGVATAGSVLGGVTFAIDYN